MVAAASVMYAVLSLCVYELICSWNCHVKRLYKSPHNMIRPLSKEAGNTKEFLGLSLPHNFLGGAFSKELP